MAEREWPNSPVRIGFFTGAQEIGGVGLHWLREFAKEVGLGWCRGKKRK